MIEDDDIGGKYLVQLLWWQIHSLIYVDDSDGSGVVG